MSKQWEKVEPNMNKVWNHKQEDGSYSLNEGDELIGIFIEKKENIGQNESTIYEFKVGDENISVWGSTVLDARLKNVEEGMEVKILYKGKTKSEKTGREYHDYDVFKREVVKEDIPVEDKEEEDIKELNKML